MRSVAFLAVALCMGGALGAFGCSSKDEGSSTGEAAVTNDELALARSAFDLISGANAHCNQCHTAGRSDVRRWGDNMLAVAQACFAGEMTPAERVACMSDDPNDPSASFSAAKLGLFSAGANRLQALFQAADPTGGRFAAFKAASMPMGTAVPAMTSEDFDKIINWVFNGLPGFNEVFGGPPEPDTCVPSISPELAAHVSKMKTEGWGARLADATTPMYGCGTATNAAGCLADKAVITQPWANAGVPQTLRKLRDLPRTSYWVRSSADGRFVGYGQFTAAAIIDLNTASDAPPIQVDARYDPSFFPNNDGISFAGTGTQTDPVGPIRVCRQSVLTNAAQQAQPHLTLQEAGCTAIIDTVYQSVGASLDGAAFWMSSGAHVNDDGGNQIQGPLPGFETESKTVLVPMVSDGISYKPKAPVEINTPLEGDQMLSPSSQLLLTRFGSKAGHRGYKIRSLTTTTRPGDAGATIGAETKDLGTICGGGGKAMVSFDERFVVTHRYADPAEDPGLPEKSANIIMTDLVTGEVIRLTNMPANQYALYPHFRADGWLYFLVRDLTPGADGGRASATETLVATDVAIKRIAPPAAAR